VKGLGIEVRSVWPNQSVCFRIKRDLIKEVRITERPVQLSSEDRQEIDNLLCMVVKTDAQGVRRDDFKVPDPADEMHHTFNSISKARWAPPCVRLAAKPNR
jgi:hypothetical protein